MSLKGSVLRNLFWLNDFCHNSLIRKHYKDVKDVFEDGRKFLGTREKNLRKLLKYTVRNCSYYQDGNVNNLDSFPVVNKSILQREYKNILVPEHRNPYQKTPNYHIQKTSGSTGTPFALPFDTRKRQRRLAELKYFGEIVGFKSHEKLIQLRIWTRWHSKSSRQSFWENIVPFDISNLGDENLSSLCDTIQKEKAICLRGYASSFDLLARYVEKHKIELPSVKIVIAGSEMLLDSTRELVKRHIGCDIISQYANEENGILAQELLGNTNNGFYFNDASYIFEVLKLDKDEPAGIGEIGRLVITDLFNYAFPIIRYDNGDTCTLAYCDKSQKYYISKLYGRRLDLLYDTNGRPVFPMLLARILKNYDEIVLQWQFIQKGRNTYLLKIIKKNVDFSTGKLIEDIKESFGQDADISVEYVDGIPILASGKRKSVINEYIQN